MILVRRVRQKRGYLLVLVAVCVSILSLSYLRLAASSARNDDIAEEDVALSVAYYAAESGLVEAGLRLEGLQNPLPPGPLLAGTLGSTGARYAVEVREGTDPKKEFRLLSIGKSEGEGGKVILVRLQAEVTQGNGKTWSVRSCERL